MYITPSKMSTPVKLCAVPTRTVLFRPICSYCGKKENFYANCAYQLSVLACSNAEHQQWAERDAKAWLHRNGSVKPKHYRNDPLFKETDLLSAEIAVKRSSGEIELHGWTIIEPSFDQPALVRFSEGRWLIPVIKCEEDIQKHIPVEELKMSLTEDKHPLVDAFEAKLETGFYKEEAEAYEEALQRQMEMDNPSAYALSPQPEDYIVNAVHPEYGNYRVFVAPSAPPSASDPVPPPPLVQLGAV